MPLTRTSFIHPDLLTSLPYAFNSLCTIQSATATQRADGSLNKTFADTNIKAIKCAVAVDSFQTQETRKEGYTPEKITHHVTMQGYYPNIEITNKAIVWRNDGGLDYEQSNELTTYNIISVEFDSKNTMTRLMVELEQE